MASSAQEITLTTSIQYHSYDYDKATADCIAMATIRGPPYETQSRSPVDIVAVIDHSGSMAGEKLDLVRKTLLFVIDQLKPCDRLCLVLYDDLVSVEFPLTPMTKQNKEMTKSKVENIAHRGATNLCGGLLKGMEQIILRGSEQKAKVASVLLFTDGLANRGIKGCDEILAAMKDPVGSLAKSGVLCTHIPFLPTLRQPPPVVPQSMEQTPPIYQLQQQAPPTTPRRQSMEQALPTYQLQQQVPPIPPRRRLSERTLRTKQHQSQATAPQRAAFLPPESTDNIPGPSCTVDFDGTIYTFGFGSDHDGDLLTAISNTANGVYYFIDSTEKIAECFADCLGGLLSVVGQNMTLTIEAQPRCTLGTVHYKNKPQMEPDNKKCVVSLGDLQSEEERDIIIPIHLEALETECLAQPLIKVTLSYFNVITTLMQATSAELAVDRKIVANCEVNEAVSIQLQRIQVALAFEEVRKIAPVDLQGARRILERSKKLLLESGVAQNQLSQALLSDLDDIVVNLRDRNAYKQRGSNSIVSFGQEHMAQRRSSSRRTGYDTSAKASMRINSVRVTMK